MTEEKKDEKVEQRIVASTGTGRFMGDIKTIRLIKRNLKGEVIEDTTHDFTSDEEPKKMGSTDKGAVAVTALFAGSGTISPYNAANARVGVGDSSTAFNVTQTDLQAPVNKFRKLVNVPPVITGNLVEFELKCLPAEANFAWNEVGIFNNPSGDYMATRRTMSLGTKPSTEEWSIILGVIFAPMS